jgi:hypothetical protein
MFYMHVPLSVQITTFPHIAIIDPRTGGCQWQYKVPATGPIVSKLLAEKCEFTKQTLSIRWSLRHLRHFT